MSQEIFHWKQTILYNTSNNQITKQKEFKENLQKFKIKFQKILIKTFCCRVEEFLEETLWINKRLSF